MAKPPARDWVVTEGRAVLFREGAPVAVFGRMIWNDSGVIEIGRAATTAIRQAEAILAARAKPETH